MANENVPLLRLPCEIRLLIYGYLFDIAPTTQLGFSSGWPRQRISVTGLGLLRTCKVLHKESRCIIYPKIIFAPESIHISYFRADPNRPEAGHSDRKDLLVVWSRAFNGLERIVPFMRKLYFDWPIRNFPTYYDRDDEIVRVLRHDISEDLDELHFNDSIYNYRYWIRRRHIAFWRDFVEHLAVPFDYPRWVRYGLDICELTRLVGFVEKIMRMKPRLKTWVVTVKDEDKEEYPDAIIIGNEATLIQYLEATEPQDIFSLLEEGYATRKGVRLHAS